MMKRMRMLSLILAASLCITSLAVMPGTVSAAKKPSIAKRASVEVGKTVTVKVKNADKKTSVKWSVSRKSVAKITKSTAKGKKAAVTVKGIKKGKAVIKAFIKNGKKKLTAKCNLTVKKAVPAAVTAGTSAPASQTPVVMPSASASPDAAKMPDVTGTPEATKAPDATGTPEVTKEPDATGTPEATKIPDATGTPEATKTPDVTEPPADTEYKGTFICDSHAGITTYKTQNLADAGKAENQSEAAARDSVTGEAVTTGEGQINFTVVTDEGYMVDSIVIAPKESYKNLKGPSDTGRDNTYRITKISGDITITVTTKEIPDTPVTEYKAVFECGGHASITTYRTQDYDDESVAAANQTEAVARDSKTGEAVVDGTGQINFRVVCEEGYRVADVKVSPKVSYKNLKDSSDSKDDDIIPVNCYRVTKIAGDITITVKIEKIDG